MLSKEILEIIFQVDTEIMDFSQCCVLACIKKIRTPSGGFAEQSAKKCGYSVIFPELHAYAPLNHFYKMCFKEFINSVFFSLR